MQMINTLVRNFLKRPATRKYPLVKRDPFENYRGRLVNHVESCIFCRMCSTKCPSQCISTNPKEAYWGYDPFSCVYCGICVEVCPTKSLFMLNTHRSPVPDKFVVYHKGQARVAKPRLAAMPKVAPSEIHAETPPPSVIAATKITSEEEEAAASPVPAARPAPVPPAKRGAAKADAAPARPAEPQQESTLGVPSEAIVHVPVSAPLEGVEVASLSGEAASDGNTPQAPSQEQPQDVPQNAAPHVDQDTAQDAPQDVPQDVQATQDATPKGADAQDVTEDTAKDAAPEVAPAEAEPTPPLEAAPAPTEPVTPAEEAAASAPAEPEAPAETPSAPAAAAVPAGKTGSAKRGKKTGGKSTKKGA